MEIDGRFWFTTAVTLFIYAWSFWDQHRQDFLTNS